MLKGARIVLFYRMFKGIKQVEFCERFKVSTNLHNRLRNDGNVSMSTIIKLMEDLGTSDYRDVIEIIAVKDDRY